MLDSVHHAGIRLATGAFKTSPIPSLLTDAGELPLDLHRQKAMLRYWIRLQRLPNSIALQVARNAGLSRQYELHPRLPQPYGFRVKELLRNSDLPRNGVLPFKFSVTPPWKLPHITFCNYFIGVKRHMNEVEIWSIFMEHVEVHENSTWIFTDGSKSHNGVGYGVYSNDFYCKGALPVFTSIFTAELLAILKAIERIIIITGTRFTVFSDSKSVLQSLAVFNSINPLVQKIQQWVFLLSLKGVLIDFCWVPAHTGIHGNEEADRLAKVAATNLPPRNCQVLCNDFLTKIRSFVLDLWQLQWHNIGINKMRDITNVIMPWKYGSMPRRWETVLCRLRIGHTRLTHGYLMAGDQQPVCDDCLVPLTIRHLLVECPSLNDFRRRFLSEALGGDGRYILARILVENVIYDTSGVFRFVVEAGLLIKI